MEQLHSLHLEANTYSRLVSDRGITANPHDLDDAALYHEGLKLMEPYFPAKRQRASERFTIFFGEGSLTALWRF